MTATDELFLFPGFMVPPGAYSSFVASIAEPSTRIVVAEADGSAARRLAGRVTVDHDARLLAGRARTSTAARVWLAGHSRGGGVVWLAARRMEAEGAAVAGLVLLDPVWGDGGPRATPPPLPAAPRCPTLIVGFGVGGPCAPVGRNHELFATAAPAARHVVVDACGHGDILDDRWARLAGVLCHHGPDRTDARAAVAALVTDFVGGA